MRLDKPVRAVLADGSHLTLGCADGSVSWYGLEDLDGEVPLWTLSLGGSPVRSLTSSSDYSRVLASTADGELHAITYAVEELPLEPVGHVSEVLACERVASFHTAPIIAATVLPLPVTRL